MKNVVTIGGGNGMPTTVVALKKFIDNINLSVVVGMSDSGGSSTGKLRKELGVLPPGDIMRAILSVSKYDYHFLKQIFYKNRFSDSGNLTNHNIGNIFLTFAAQYSDFMTAVRAFEQALESVATVYPTTLEKSNLLAELQNGDIIFGEADIDEPKYDNNIKIKKVWLEKENEKESPAIYVDTKKVLGKADYIFLGPGDLYTSVIATILPKGFKEALQKSKAKLIYVFGNAYHLTGETGPTEFSEAVLTLEKYIGRKLDYIIYNNHILNKEEKEKYKERGWELIGYDKENLLDHNVLECDYERIGGGLCPDKLANSLKEIMGL
ncbi:MAG: gluconeogenesis factor YvcK family protein [Candidatus Magasanikbacteria bacterium]